MNNQFAIIDFETTGLSPQDGDRITEVAVVRIESDRVVDQYQSLVKTGAHISYEIERITGISNQMLADAPPASAVLPELHKFIGNANLVAHNASFDSKFLHAELSNIGIDASMNFICTLLLSRRLYPFSPNLKLFTLAQYHGIRYEGRSHRALADAFVTAELFLKIRSDLKRHLATPDLTAAKMIRVQKEPLKNFSGTAHQIHIEKSKVSQNRAAPIIQVAQPSYRKPESLKPATSLENEGKPNFRKKPEVTSLFGRAVEIIIKLVGLLVVGGIGLAVVIKFPWLLIPLGLFLWKALK